MTPRSLAPSPFGHPFTTFDQIFGSRKMVARPLGSSDQVRRLRSCAFMRRVDGAACGGDDELGAGEPALVVRRVGAQLQRGRLALAFLMDPRAGGPQAP